MAFDQDKFRAHLKESGIFSDAEIDAEVLSAQKDDKAEERRAILNTQKVETAPVAQSSPAIAAAAAPPAPTPATVSVPTVPAGTTAADVFTGKTVPSGMGTPPEQRVGQVGQNVAAAGGNFVQDSLDYAKNALANDPYLPAKVLLPLGVGYGLKKAAEGGLFSDLGSKIAAKFGAASNQPQPFVGGSGPRNTPPAPAPAVTPAATPIQDWDIHNEPALFAPTPAAAPTVTAAPAAAPSRNLTLEEAQARMAGVTPAATAPVVPQAVAPEGVPMQPVVPSAAKQAALADYESKIATSDERINQLLAAQKQNDEFIRINNEKIANQNAPLSAAPVEPSADQVAAAKAAEEKKAKMPLFSDADKKAFTSEQRSVLQHMQYGQSPEEAKNLLRHFENTLPEGVKLSYGTYPEDVYNEAGKKVKTAGTSKGGFPEPKQSLLNFWNEALGTNHAINEKGNFDYKPTPEDVTKAHSYWSEKMANATTPAAKSIAEKGYATLGAMAKLAGVSLGALGAMHAYKTGKETGDWSDLGLLGGSLLAGASVPAQIAYQGLTYSKPLGETQEQLKQLGKQLEYAGKVGYGRGLVNPANAIPPPRHTMTNR